MANPLFQALGGGQMPGQMVQFQNMVQQFRQFQQTFQGDPKAEVEAGAERENLAAAAESNAADGCAVPASARIT